MRKQHYIQVFKWDSLSKSDQYSISMAGRKVRSSVIMNNRFVDILAATLSTIIHNRPEPMINKPERIAFIHRNMEDAMMFKLLYSDQTELWIGPVSEKMVVKLIAQLRTVDTIIKEAMAVQENTDEKLGEICAAIANAENSGSDTSELSEKTISRAMNRYDGIRKTHVMEAKSIYRSLNKEVRLVLGGIYISNWYRSRVKKLDCRTMAKVFADEFHSYTGFSRDPVPWFRP